MVAPGRGSAAGAQPPRQSPARAALAQLWRYYPQALEVADGDAAADWFLELWSLAPTPAKAARVRESSLARVLKAHRIRRLDAAEALRLLRQAPLAVAAGTTEAAVAHIRTLVPRLQLVNRQLKEAHRRLDALCAAALAGTDDEETAPGHAGEQAA